MKYPILPEPPYAHAITNWDAENRILTYAYNGRPTIQISIPGSAQVDYRASSDGDLVSDPMVQQQYVVVSEPVTATVRFHLSGEALNMRPHRARSEQAILGQVGRPLIYGVNGLYDLTQDLMIDWHGAAWNWLGERLIESGPDSCAEMVVVLGPSPWIINLKIHYYRRHLGYRYHTPWRWRPQLEPVSGWCSWEAYRREITEQKVGEMAQFVEEQFKPYGMQYIQVDDGFQPAVIPSTLDKSIADDWLSTNAQFPGGHTGIINAVTERGLKAGIWIYTYVHNQAYAETNPGFIKNQDGSALEGDWIGFVVDCLPETLARYVVPSFEGFKRLGYDYVKTDGLRHLIYDGLQEAVRRGLLSNEEAELRFRGYVEAIRQALGPNVFYLSSWGVMTQMVGIADACRIATDLNPSWPHMRMQMVETARWFHTQRILFINDPDHLCLRACLDWARSAVSLTSLSGGLFMLSDALEEYDAVRIRMIQQSLPTLQTYTAETGPLNTDMQAYTWTKAHGAAFTGTRHTGFGMDRNVSEEALIRAAGQYPTMDDQHPFSTLWAIHLDVAGMRWCVVGRFATTPLNSTHLTIESLGLDPGCFYLAFDFWAQYYLGCFQGEIPLAGLGLGCCQILALRPATGRPQLLASSRHISMDAISVHRQTWENNCLSLDLKGVPGKRETYWVHKPISYNLDGYLDGPYTISQSSSEIIEIAVDFPEENITIGLKFISRGD